MQPTHIAPLDEQSADPDPFVQFRAWLDAAMTAVLHEPTAMVLATVGMDGRPAARAVLLKGVDARGFVFFTNYESRKARDLAANPFAALTFLWAELGRQVRVEGTVERVSAEESEAYFATRARGSRIGAWASPQSRVVANREDLERRVAEAAARFEGDAVPRPPHWGGYRVVPDVIEFWQGRPDRLHDRLVYRRDAADWRIERLAP